MANTRQSAKRARQTDKRRARNVQARGAMKSTVRAAVETIQKKDSAKAAEAYLQAIRALSKAASKGAIPRARAERKISRLTLLAKRAFPEALKATAAKS